MKICFLYGPFICRECGFALVMLVPETGELFLRHPSHAPCSDAGKRYQLPTVELAEIVDPLPCAKQVQGGTGF